MINFAPSDASSDSAPWGSSAATPVASSPSILACISADGGTLRLTAQASFNRLAGLEGTYAVALTATDLQQLGDATQEKLGRRTKKRLGPIPRDQLRTTAAREAKRATAGALSADRPAWVFGDGVLASHPGRAAGRSRSGRAQPRVQIGQQLDGLAVFGAAEQDRDGAAVMCAGGQRAPDGELAHAAR